MNMESPLISVIVPVFNRETLLPATLDSLWSQTYRPFEVVLVDNGSSDGSLAVCEAFRHNHDSSLFSVKVLSQPKRGANAARNTGFEASGGKYVLFFDSDDTLYPDSLARMAANLLDNDAPDMLVFPFELVFPDGHRSRRPHRFSADPAAQLIDTVAATHNMCLKRSLVVKAGCWDETVLRWQDLEFGFRLLLKAETVAWINGKPFHEVKVHASSISGPAYSVDMEYLEAALAQIGTVIQSVEDKRVQNHLQRALCFKRTVLAGNLWQEGQYEMSKVLYVKTQQLIPAGSGILYVFALKVNYLYMKLKGRGFWRLADWLS
jgi:glycosyltransferase involved in cell wall biosynthesis